MTWYRVGPAGIPGSLKTDMDAVLNKKFGTSATYPPNTWPDNVNLLGPLPERTASGAIANITDGADRVPLKNWIVTLPASLDGYTEVNGYKANTNFYDDKHLNVGLPATAIGSSIDTINTTATRYTYNGFSSPRSNIAIKGSRNDTSIVCACLFFGYSGGFLTEYRSINPFGSSAVVVDCSGFDYVRISIGAASGYQAPTDMTAYGYMSAEYGTTFTEYVPADTEQYTASLGRTIYGGTADIVNGQGSDEYNAPITLNGSENWQKHGSLASWFYVDNLLVDAYANNAETGFIASSWGTQKAYSQVSSLANGEYAYGAINRFVIKNTDFTEVEDFTTWLSSNPITLVCKSATGTDFTFTPITPTPETALGVNNFWADEGDSDVTYRADISLALQALGGGGRGPMGMMMQRPEEEQLTETEEDPEEQPEETETNER